MTVSHGETSMLYQPDQEAGVAYRSAGRAFLTSYLLFVGKLLFVFLYVNAR